MNKLLTTFIILLISIPSICQESNVIDSLLSELEKANEDSVKVEILLRLFNPTVVNDLDLAYEYTNQAHQLSEKLSFDKGLAAAYQRKGIIWGYRGNIEKARENYLKAIEVHERLDREVIAATLIYNLALLFKEQGSYDSAMIYNHRASIVFLQHQDSLKYASTLDLFSGIQSEQGNYSVSLKYATEATDLFRLNGDELREADALLKIGDVFSMQNNFENAIQYYQQAIMLYKKHNDKHWGNFTTQKVASAYLSLGEIEKADSIIDQSILISDSLGAIQILSEGFAKKGDILFEKGDYKQAINYFDNALQTNKEAADSTFIATQNISIGRCYQALGDHVKARNYYLSVLPITQKMDVKENLRTIYLQLSKLYEHENNDHMAYSYFKKYTEVINQIYNQESARQIADMQTKYDTEQKEREIDVQNQKITILEQKAEIQNLVRMRLIVSIIVVIFVFLLLFYVFLLRTKRKRLKQQLENERLVHELDLKKRELTTHALHIIQKNELLENLQNKVAEIEKNQNVQVGVYGEIKRIIKANKMIERDWDNFKSVFEQVNPTFFSRLKAQYPNISSNELRMAAMMKMNLNTKEMASILNITPDSVKKARYRMRKKLHLEAEAKVEDYLINL